MHIVIKEGIKKSIFLAENTLLFLILGIKVIERIAATLQHKIVKGNIFLLADLPQFFKHRFGEAYRTGYVGI